MNVKLLRKKRDLRFTPFNMGEGYHREIEDDHEMNDKMSFSEYLVCGFWGIIATAVVWLCIVIAFQVGG